MRCLSLSFVSSSCVAALLAVAIESNASAQLPVPIPGKALKEVVKIVPLGLLPASTSTTPGEPAPIEGGFTIMVMPDTQYYSQQYPDTFHKQTQWIADTAAKYNTVFVAHLGDITETAADAEWKVAQAAFARLDGKLPYLPTPGNHDYGGRLQVQTHRSPYTNFFPVAGFQKMATFGGTYDKEPEKSDNQYHRVTVGGRKWMVIALEYAPRTDVLRWAGDVCRANPEHSVIITTHAYLDPRTNRRFPGALAEAKKEKKPDEGVKPAKERPDLNQGEDMWQKLVSKHGNIALVLCGHASYTAHVTSTGEAGNTVHEVVVDYQRDVNGGDGWMRLLQFLPDGKTVRTRDYSPTLNLTCTMSDRCYDMVFELPKAPTGSAVSVLAAAALQVTAAAPAAPASTKEKPKASANPVMDPIKDVPGLPRVLLIGDSISIGYTMPVRKLLEGKANVHRIPTNGGPTKNGIANIDKWLGNGKWDVIHFNWGIHDLKYMPDGKRQVEPEDYEKNLRALVKKMKSKGTKLIWATTTPIPDGELNPPRRFGQVKEYNEIAARVMQDEGVVVDDLNAWITPDLAKLQNPKDVHYNAAGSDRLGEKVAEEITKALPASNRR
ncbi:lysophospholipase L1-like esterase [Roseimicrobium gellanilyticum]|uniref:Lysophospholipase L1-like esterase n=1 Tax=Roseimicrobium gellanilyticum TaxID=748857 RepID=A0A366HUG9_9BACT|nr:GDSL-type esterase/lipase family protein [Roseimicrobium gellanilyticum]RBP47922.1 lysophospholipase L1-like esterase [Roseimicrobium gellanilyticum]